MVVNFFGLVLLSLLVCLPDVFLDGSNLRLVNDLFGALCYYQSCRGAVRHSEAWKAWDEFVAGLVSPKPPSLTGRARRSRSYLEQGARPVRAGIMQTLVDSSLQGE